MIKYFSFVFCVLITYSGFSQDTLRIDSIDNSPEIVITYRAVNSTPVTFQDIDAPQLKLKTTGQEPSFLLTETPSVTNYSDAGSYQGYSYFRLRGIDQTRINMTLDGVPMNEPEDQGAYFSNYPDIFNSLSKIQIQRGVGTSQNGVASYGGSIQLFSPNLEDSAKTTVGIGYGSFNSLRAFTEFNSGIKNKKALYVRASEIYSDGYKYHSSNHSQSVFMSGGWFRNKSTWKVNLLVGHQQNGLAWLGVSDSLIAIDRRTNANTNGRDNFTQCLLQFQHHARTSKSSSIQSSVYYTFLNGNYDFNLNDFLGLPSTNELYNYAFRSNLVGFFSNYTLTKNRFNWTSGVHGNIYARSHTGSENTMGELYTNTGYKNEISVFSKANYTCKRFTFFADIQFRYTTFSYNGTAVLDKIQWHFINPKAGVSYKLRPQTIAYYSIGGTGREPTRNDMFQGNDDLPADSNGKGITGNTHAEYVVNQELGIRHHLNKGFINLNFYYMDFKNEIVLDGEFGPNGLALTNNVHRSIRSGIEFSFTYKLNTHFTFINNTSFNYSRIKEQQETFSPIITPPFIFNQEVVYTQGNFFAALSGRYQEKSFIDFANTETINSYFLLDGRIGYGIRKYQLCLFVKNITNIKYFNNAYIDADGRAKYFVQAPTNFYVTFKYSF